MAAILTWKVTAQPSAPGPTAGAKGFRDLKLGDDGDLVIERGRFATVAGLEAIAQAVRVALQLFKGEWFDDPTAGVAWLSADGQQILGQKGVPEALIRAELTKAITGVRGVKSLASMSLDLTGRQLNVSFVAIAEGGTITGSTA